MASIDESRKEGITPQFGNNAGDGLLSLDDPNAPRFDNLSDAFKFAQRNAEVLRGGKDRLPGDRTFAGQDPGIAASRTRGCVAGGYASSDSNVIDFVTMASTGNASNFGDLTQTGHGVSMCINDSTRGVFAGRTSAPTFRNTIDYITIASTGDAQDFGDLNQDEVYSSGMCSPTRGVFAGGSDPTVSNVIDYITIQTLGNALDFGDITTTGRAQAGGCSNGHGGL